MRIATWNVEWFARLFDDRDRLLDDDGWSGRRDITRARQIEAIAKVMVAVNADILLVVEAPNTGNRQRSDRALERFARAFGLRTRRAVCGFASETQQEITLVHDPDAVRLAHDPLGGTGPAEVPRFDGAYHPLPRTDGIAESVRFSKPPIEACAETPAGTRFRLIGVHTKSKAPHGAKSLKSQMQMSIRNRRKQLAQCVWIRARVEAIIAAGEPLIVLGDLNDGPGLDRYERLFGRSGVEIVMGPENGARLFDPNALAATQPRVKALPATARFFIESHGTYLNALLDYVMVSPDLRPRTRRWTIWHPFDHPACYRDAELREALLTASDHFPVSLDIDIDPPAD